MATNYFFSNKTSSDIILHEELDQILGSAAHYILTREDNPKYIKGYLNKEFILNNISDFQKQFYVCGPDQMVQDVTMALSASGATSEQVIFEK